VITTMARPTAKGVEYFPLNVNFINDLKVRKLLLSCGAEAIAVLIYLLSTIYKDEGYYVEIHEDEIDLIALDVNVTPEFVLEVINKACEVRFFDVNLYNNFNILTSKGIQERYLKITERRKNSVVITQFNLINVYNNSINVNNNLINVDNNPVNVYKSTQSKVKERKEKKRKVKSLSNDSVKNVYLTETKKRDCMNKKIYELYLNGIGQISPTIKERLDDLVELYGMEHVIVAINTTIESGGSSIKYVETVAASNLKKKVNDNGTNKRRPGTGATEATDGSEIDWSQGNTEWL
jgi:dnaD domain protein